MTAPLTLLGAPCPSPGPGSVQYAAVRQHHLEVQHILPHRAVPVAQEAVSHTHLGRDYPYLTALVPEAPVAAIPHRDASAPGSEGRGRG